MKIEKTDFLVLGGGVAGLRAAIALGEAGRVCVLTKDLERESNTRYAQGGVAVALSDEDQVGLHVDDTIKAGAGLCRPEAVKILVGEGPRYIAELIDWGAEFDRQGTRLHFTREAAHSRRRILHAQGDATGQEIVRALLAKVKTIKNLKQVPRTFALDLIKNGSRVIGVRYLQDGQLKCLLAKAVVLCTGGLGRLYQESTNPSLATGDGMAMAWRAGAALQNMELIQFHPTALYRQDTPRFLISEAVRGEGGFLKNAAGERFMSQYHPARELAPRDVVSRSILFELKKSGHPCVYLDLSHLKADFVANRFPRIYKTCLDYGLDITCDQIPVHPASHYMMGGVATDTQGRTTLPGLFAAGEVACTGVHGANRLASNSLLEGLVFGARAGELARGSTFALNEPETLDGLTFNPLDDEKVDELRREIARIMWQHAGIIRDGAGLLKASHRLSEIRETLNAPPLARRAWETANMALLGEQVVRFALNRNESRGGHYREDYPHPRQDIAPQEFWGLNGEELLVPGTPF